MTEILGSILGRLIRHPHGVALAQQKLDEQLVQGDSVGGIAGNYDLGLQATLVAYGQKAHDGSVGAFAEQVEPNFQDAVRVATAEQFDAKLIEQHELFDLLGARQTGEGVFVRFLYSNGQVLHDGLHQLRIVALSSRWFFGFVKFEFGRANSNGVSIDDRGFVDFLAVDERAVWAFGVAGLPNHSGVEGECGMHSRAERIGEQNVTVRVPRPFAYCDGHLAESWCRHQVR